MPEDPQFYLFAIPAVLLIGTLAEHGGVPFTVALADGSRQLVAKPRLEAGLEPSIHV